MPDPQNGQEASALLPLHDLGARHSDESEHDLFAEEEYYGQGFDAINHSRLSRTQKILVLLRSFLPIRYPSQTASRASKPSRPILPWFLRVLLYLAVLGAVWAVSMTLFFPSYTRPPTHYVQLKDRVSASALPGRANINNEKVFIAASIYDADGALLNGDWGKAVAELIDLLGPSNVFLSIYENDASEVAAKAMDDFGKNLDCQKQLLNEHLDISDLQRVVMPDGRRLLKRIAFLARVRNRALAPLDDEKSPAQGIKFDRILYINDVMFQPIDAANLLFSTHQAADGRADYRAACAVDFINPWKFYDTFATRDLGGYDMGVPIYPWFTSAGHGESRKDVQRQTDAVRVRSCWGGMVAFDASYFQSTSKPDEKRETTSLTPVRFRAEEDPFWDASECCLIHADIQAVAGGDLTKDTGIYMNPFIRVSYDSNTLSWLWLTRRFERLTSPFQSILNYFGKRPSNNPRRLEQPGDLVKDRVWVSNEIMDTGAYEDVERVAKPGAFCGNRMLLALPEDGHGGHWWPEDPPRDVLRGL